MPHEVKRPTDDCAVAIGGQPAGYAKDFAVAVDRVEQAYPGVDQFVDATQGESHFRQGLFAGPLCGNLTNLRLYGEGCLLESGEHVGDAVSFGFVDGGAHVLPFLASGLPFVGIDDHFRADVK